MYQVISCPNGLTVNPDDTLSCPGWVLVDLPAPDPIHALTPAQLSELSGQIIICFVVAYVFRFIVRWLSTDRFGRGS